MMPYIAPIYYSTFVLASQFVLVNVVVAVLMKQLEDAKSITPVLSMEDNLNRDCNNDDNNNANGDKNVQDDTDETGSNGAAVDDPLVADSFIDRSVSPHSRRSECSINSETETEKLPLLDPYKNEKLDSIDGGADTVDSLPLSGNPGRNIPHVVLPDDEGGSILNYPDSIGDAGDILNQDDSSHRDIAGHLDSLDLQATLDGLSGLRDSVISTCV